MNKKIESAWPETEDQERTQVENEIGFARQMCAAMGNNDTEFERLDNIWFEYNEGRLTALQAITQARAVPENKIQR